MILYVEEFIELQVPSHLLKGQCTLFSRIICIEVFNLFCEMIKYRRFHSLCNVL